MKEMCCNDSYLIIGLEDKYLGNWHNNARHLFGASMHVGIVDMHTLSPWPCEVLLHVYEDHVSSQSFICLK